MKHSTSWMPMDELTDDKAMLVLVRHGQSEWNFANRFIGWYDSPLTPEGEWEAADAGRLLREHKIEVDEVHTSMLTRTLSTARIALRKMRKRGLSVPDDSKLRSTWRLNERSYGALTGKNKKECTKKYGKDQLKLWRRSWDVPPPQYEDGCELYMKETEAFREKVSRLSGEGLFDAEADPAPGELPRGESLKDTTARLRPYWENTLLPSLQRGRKVMVFGHENNLRALVKLMDGIGDDSILQVDIPRAMPMVYFFEREQLVTSPVNVPRLKPVRLTPEDAADGNELLSARYLVDAELIHAFHMRDVKNVYDTSVEENLEEVCVVDGTEEASEMCQVIGEFQHDYDDEDEDSHLVDGEEVELLGQTKIVMRDENMTKPSSTKAPAPAFVAALLPHSPSIQPPLRTGGYGADPEVHVGALGPDFSASAVLCCAAAFLAVPVALRKRQRQRRLSYRAWATKVRVKTAETEVGKEVEESNDDFFDIYDVYDEDAAAMAGLQEDDEDEECDPTTDLECAIEAGVVENEDEICELLGYEMGKSVVRMIGRDFTADERQKAHAICGMDQTQSSSKPQAIWLIGPSASGKSTLAPEMMKWIGCADEGAVTIDGEAFREAHRGYQEALHKGKQRGCTWWGAYVGIRANVNKEKQLMLEKAVNEHKHLIIPSTCLRASQCVDVVRMLLEKKYEVHIVGIHGDKDVIVNRGRLRATEKGKRYDPREFRLALGQFGPMLKLCNGRYRMVCTTPGGGQGEKLWELTDEGKAPLSPEEVEAVCDRVMQRYPEERAALAQDKAAETAAALSKARAASALA